MNRFVTYLRDALESASSRARELLVDRQGRCALRTAAKDIHATATGGPLLAPTDELKSCGMKIGDHLMHVH